MRSGLRSTPEFNSPHCDVTWWKREMTTVTTSHSNQQVFIIHVDHTDTPEHTSNTITAGRKWHATIRAFCEDFIFHSTCTPTNTNTYVTNTTWKDARKALAW